MSGVVVQTKLLAVHQVFLNQFHGPVERELHCQDLACRRGDDDVGGCARERDDDGCGHDDVQNARVVWSLIRRHGSVNERKPRPDFARESQTSESGLVAGWPC